MGIKIHGMRGRVFKESGNVQVQLLVGRPITDFENDTMKAFGVGCFDSVDDWERKRGVKERYIDAQYANEIIQSGAFVPYEEYDVIISPDPEDPLKDVVTKLIPVKDEVRKHFDSCLKGNK